MLRAFESLLHRYVLRAHGIVVGAIDRETGFRPTFDDRCGRVRRFDLDRVYRLPVETGTELAVPAVIVPHDRSLAMLLHVRLPAGTSVKEAQFDVMQRHAGHITGGSTYLLRTRRKRR